MAAVWVFDVNETLLDVSALDGPVFGGDAALRRRWFSQLVQSALLESLLGAYRPFGELGAAALAMVAPDADPEALRAGMRALPPHPDVRPALEALRARGDRLAALTQNMPEVLEAQLAHAGLADCFEAALSADEAGRLKPAPAPYALAARRLGAAPSELTMVAAHTWDLAGAAAAGLRTTLVVREGVVPDPARPAPDVTVRDLRELAAG